MVPQRGFALFMTVAFVLLAAAMPASAQQPAGAQRAGADPNEWTVLLNGTWAFAAEGSSEFEPAKVPGFWGGTPQAQKVGFKVAGQWKTGTYRRSFEAPAGKTGAVLEFEQLRWGGQVLVNGKMAGTYDLGHSPVTFDISALVRPGKNVLEVRPRGWTALERYEGKDVQIPVGAGNWFGIKDGGIPDDVYLRFYNGARIESLRITAQPAGMTCEVATQVVAADAPWQGTLVVQIRSDDGKIVYGEARREGVRLEAGKATAVQLKGMAAPQARAWTPENPVLYRAVAWLEDARGQTAAVRDDTFGFRSVAIKDGKFHLNGKPFRLFGATELVMYRLLQMMDDPAKLQRVQVDLFKGMNAVAFRSHQNPLPRRWIDLCDRAGILILSEWPNFPDVQRKGEESPYELPEYWKNLQRESRGIVAGRFNHPSIVGWVVSNEGTTFGDWERANLVPFVKDLDPGRLVMLSGDVTPDVADQHNFAGMWWGTQGEFERAANDLARFYPARLVGCTEYGQYGPMSRWYGLREVKRDSPEFQEDLARILMEQTEALRRARFGLIMPYAYGGGWFGKKAGETGRVEDAARPYQAFRQALAPLGVSIDFRRHVTAGTKVDVRTWVLSDAEDAAGTVEVNVYLLDRHPGYDWNGRTDGLKVLAEGRYETKITAWQACQQAVSLTMPSAPGQVCLAAIVRRQGQTRPAAISVRPVRVHPPLPVAKRPLKVGVIERDGRIAKWAESRGHQLVLAYGAPRPDVIVIGEGMLGDERLRTHGGPLAKRVLVGGTRMVILEQCQWDADVAQVDMNPLLSGMRTAAMQTAVENLFPQPSAEAVVGTAGDFQRLNGLDNIAMRVALVPVGQVGRPAEGSAPARLTPETGAASQAAATTQAAATQADAWTSLVDGYGLKGDVPGWAVAHRTFGEGEVFACQVPVLERLDRADRAGFDPTVERLLVYLVEGQPVGRE